MADETPKTANTPSSSGAAAALNKAQAEFDKYTRRVQAQRAGMVSALGAPGWAMPPSVTMLPRHPGGGGGAAAPGSLTATLGDSLRLGLDVLNAGLAGGVRLLNGIAGLTGTDHEGCGCKSCCPPDCCEPDCCGCECCNPGVGTCC